MKGEWLDYFSSGYPCPPAPRKVLETHPVAAGSPAGNCLEKDLLEYFGSKEDRCGFSGKSSCNPLVGTRSGRSGRVSITTGGVISYAEAEACLFGPPNREFLRLNLAART
jgi:hypothetical protein